MGEDKEGLGSGSNGFSIPGGNAELQREQREKLLGAHQAGDGKEEEWCNHTEKKKYNWEMTGCKEKQCSKPVEQGGVE